MFFVMILLPAVLSPLCPAADEKGFDPWFREIINSDTYGSIYEELKTVIEKAREHEIPENLILDRIKEGCAKKVPPARLAAAIKAELTRLETAADILSQEDIVFQSNDEEISLYRGISILLSGDFSRSTVESLLNSSRGKENRADSFISAGHALLAVREIAGLSEEEFRKLGKSLINSNLPIQSYSTTASLFLKGMVQKRSPETILVTIIDILDQGGGIVQMEREINRRRTRR